jgi:hypothetical protein
MITLRASPLLELGEGEVREAPAADVCPLQLVRLADINELVLRTHE